MDRLLKELNTIALGNYAGSQSKRSSSLSAIDISTTLYGHVIRISREGDEGEIAEAIVRTRRACLFNPEEDTFVSFIFIFFSL